MQKLVGGYIQTVDIDPNYVAVINENSKILDTCIQNLKVKINMVRLSDEDINRVKAIMGEWTIPV